DTGYAKQIGNNNQYLKLNLIQPPIFEDVFEAIAFNQADYYEAISKGQPFNICYTIEENSWNGNTNIQLNIKDIKFANQ
ncbi:MAG: single-stranded-DNA-specific exonuclease RecJ, partial [Bacteroidales bacterium]|nr:single-stranded-DNA-specific exonuclease RecJ [Bacteroidales bacterium]